jgi:drug/metabolite transporter (DMT)-like permease
MSKGFKFTIIAAFIWAVSIIIVRLVLDSGESVLSLMFWTSILSSPYWFYIAWKRRGEFKSMSKKDWAILAATGLIGAVGIHLMEFLALKYSTSINYAFLIRTVILFTIVFAYLFLGEKLTWKKIIISCVILIGSYLLATDGQLLKFSLGDIFTIIEAIFIAFGNNVLGKMAINKMSHGISASVSYLFGVIPILFMPIIFQSVFLPQNWLAILGLIFLYILLRNFRYRAYQHATASYVTMVFSATPVMVTIMALSLPFLNETISPLQVVGGILITLAGVGVEKLKV